MLNIRHRLTGAAAATLAAGAIAVSGAAVASAAPHAARPAASGTEQFQLMDATVSNSSHPSIIARGVFTAGGVDHSGNKVDTVVFPNGTFKITHGRGTGSQHVNPKTCLMTVNGKGPYTLSGGTGAYAGISGSGTYHLSILAVAARSGGTCSKTAPPVAFQELIRASGPVKM
jgi:hypothetical protein